jgi:hypothetical protein
MVRKWIDLADCLPPKIRAYQGNRFTTAGDTAIPVRIARSRKTKKRRTAFYAKGHDHPQTLLDSLLR